MKSAELLRIILTKKYIRANKHHNMIPRCANKMVRKETGDSKMKSKEENEKRDRPNHKRIYTDGKLPIIFFHHFLNSFVNKTNPRYYEKLHFILYLFQTLHECTSVGYCHFSIHLCSPHDWSSFFKAHPITSLYTVEFLVYNVPFEVFKIRLPWNIFIVL